MIVIVGSAAYRAPREDGRDGAEGRGPAIARVAVGAGRQVQLVARIGDDPAGDAVLVALARDGIEHAAVLRDAGERTRLAGVVSADDDGDDLLDDASGSEAFGCPGPSLRAPDIELALRYLPDIAVVVSADPVDEAAFVALVGAASFARAHLVLASAAPEAAAPPADQGSFTDLEAPDEDPDGAFARFVGLYAAALDAGQPAGDAFRGATVEMGWEPVPAEH